MQQRKLGDTGLSVSVLGLGTVKFGRNQGVKYPSGFELPGDAEILNLLAICREHGINLLDSAPAYGVSESRLGALLKHRSDWVICSKVGEEFDPSQTPASHYDYSRKHTIHSIERSLQRLNTDYLDMVLIHSNGQDLRVLNEDVVATLLDLKQQGKIRALGISSKTVTGALTALRYLDVAMITYNPANTREQQVLQYAQQNNKGILIKKAFSSGHFAQVNSARPVHDSLAFILREAAVASIIVGTINPIHLQENIQAVAQILTSPGQ